MNIEFGFLDFQALQKLAKEKFLPLSRGEAEADKVPCYLGDLAKSRIAAGVKADSPCDICIVKHKTGLPKCEGTPCAEYKKAFAAGDPAWQVYAAAEAAFLLRLAEELWDESGSEWTIGRV